MKVRTPYVRTSTSDSAKILTTRGWSVGPRGCWECNGAGDKNGYRVFNLKGVKIKAHRLAYETWVGPISEGLMVRHKCDNPPCINPEHLEVGTNSENQLDRVRRRPETILRGTRLSHSRLTEHDVRDIRAEYARGILTQQMLADVYGVRRTHIGDIINFARWAWVT